MLAEVAFSCLLTMLGGKAPASPVCDTPYLHQVATAVDAAHEEFPNVPKRIVVAVMYHESRFKQFAIGSHHEVGLMQLLRGGAVQGEFRRLSNRQLADVNLNIWLGTQHLAKFVSRCTAPRFWLTPYNGGRCVVSKYSTRILKELQAAERRSISMSRGNS